MTYVFLTFDHFPELESGKDWLIKTKIYDGILQYLARQNTVYCLCTAGFNESYSRNGIQYKILDYGGKKSHFPWKLNFFVKSLKPDIVFVQGLHNPLQLIQLNFLLKKSTKIMVQHHAEQPFEGWRKKIQKIADKFVDAYLFASTEMGNNWVKKGNLRSSDKIHEVMEVSSTFHPIDQEQAKKTTEMAGNPNFLWVGRLNQNKDPLNVVSAFLNFADDNPTAKLYMIFHTDELAPELWSLIRKSANGAAIIILGKVEHDELLFWYNAADYFISGSFYEGSGTALCEAMSCGCVPIVTDIPSFRMLTDYGNCGFLYEAGNKQELIAALKKTKDLNLKQMQINCLEYFNKNLSFEAIGKQIAQIAKSLAH